MKDIYTSMIILTIKFPMKEIYTSIIILTIKFPMKKSVIKHWL